MHRIMIPVWMGMLLLSACTGKPEKNGNPAPGNGEIQGSGQVEAIYEEADRKIAEEMLQELAPFQGEAVDLLVARAGKMFLETPYVAHTLERDSEVLVINLRELDCTTYAENCLAIARTVQGGAPSFDRFLEELQFIRYRDGELDGYPSRLHYFCDWIRNNDQKGVVEECAASLGGAPLKKEINFMSTHPESYSRLDQDPALVEMISEQEASINQRQMYYIPVEKLGELEELLKEGDIVGITTSMEGLAVMHVGILVRVDGRIHLMHASSAAGKVVISENTLEEYLQQRQTATGIMVARPISMKKP